MNITMHGTHYLINTLRNTLVIVLSLIVTSVKGQVTANTVVKLVMTTKTQFKEADNIAYKKGERLSIKDFEGTPDAQNKAVGMTYSGFTMSMKAEGNADQITVQVEVGAYFNKSNSWLKKEGKNDTVLSHEQNHFYLTAIQACAFQQAVAQKRFSPLHYKSELKKLYQEHQHALEKIQQQYDAETQHGIKYEKELMWTKRIAEQVENMTCY
jgi:hypothetical protein